MFPRLLSSFILLTVLAMLSRVDQGASPEYGVLRLSWKTVGEKIRVSTAAQGEDVPAHMRTQQGYEERMRSYRLTVEVDGKPWLDKEMRPPGWRHDRPISVFEELALPPGEHDLYLRFWPVPEHGATWHPELHRKVAIRSGAIETISLTDQK